MFRLGEAVGKMFSGLLNNVPGFYQIPVTILFCFILLFVLLLIFGYKIRLPFFLGEISPGQAPALPGHDVQALELRNKELRLEVKELKQLMGQFQPQSLAIAQEPRMSSVSGVEDLVAVSDQHQEIPGSQVFPWIQPPGTPSRRRNREVVLTPIKKECEVGKNEKNDETDVNEADGGTKTEEALEKCPKSPSKKLFVKNCHNPNATKFEWVEVQESSQGSSEGIIIDKEPGDIDSDFLEKVEEIFDDSK